MRKGNQNEALIKKMLGDSIDQAFVISAVEYYCNEVLSDSTDWGNQSLVNKDLWQTIAKQNLFIMKEHYK
jgi:hypothetical protein